MDCLRSQAGSFADRNSCRGSALHILDLRVRLGLARIQGHSFDIVVDGLNLLDDDENE